MTKPILPYLCQNKTSSSFTLVELLAVITIIGILAGLTLGAAGAVRRHSASSRAKSEIVALQAACERYYADQSQYPTNTNSTTDPTTGFNPDNYKSDVIVLFTNLLGSSNITSAPTMKRYFEPKASMVQVNYFIDPWGKAYGYFSDGTNAPLIWSTANQTSASGTNQWITSWPKM